MIAIAYLSLIAPILLVDVPPLLDYPNHFARMWLIAGGAKLSPLDHMYAIDWSRASTNIGIDLLAATLGGVIGKANVGPLTVALMAFTPCLGCMLLNRRAFGGAHWWQLAFVLPAFGKTVLAGFLNFNIALGLALGKDFAPLRAWTGLKPRIAPAALAVLATLVPVALILIFSPHSPMPRGRAIVSWEPFSVPNLIGVLLAGFHAYVAWYDALVVAILLVLAGAALILRRLRVHAGLLLAGLAFAILSPLVPTRIGDGYWLEYRLPTIAAFVLMAAIRPDLAISARAKAAMAALLFTLGAARTGVVGAAWMISQNDIRSLRRVLEAVPPGASVLPLANDAPADQRRHAPLGRYFGDHPAYWSYGALAVPMRRAFVPGLFAIAGQQPLNVLGGWAPMSAPHGARPPPVAELHAASYPAGRRYLSRWRSFDYILLLDADMSGRNGERLPSQDVELVSDGGFAALYRIKPVKLAGVSPPR